MSHGTHIAESYHEHQRVMSRKSASHVTKISESCHENQRVMSQKSASLVTHHFIIHTWTDASSLDVSHTKSCHVTSITGSRHAKRQTQKKKPGNYSERDSLTCAYVTHESWHVRWVMALMCDMKCICVMTHDTHTWHDSHDTILWYVWHRMI